jgi:MFS family permease
VSIAGIAWGVFNVGFALFFSFSPALLADRGMSTAGASSLVSLGMWVTVFSVPLGGLLAERTGRPNTIAAVSAIASGTTLALMPVFDAPIAFVVAFGVGIGGAGAIMAMSVQALSPENRGPGIGLFFTWYYAAMAVGPAVAGKGRDITDSAATPVLLGASMFVLVIFLVAAFQVHQSRKGQPAPRSTP